MRKFPLLLAAGLVGLLAAASPAGALTTSYRFLEADTDRDGRVSRREYDRSGDRWFDRVDSDGDRTITRKEASAWKREIKGWCYWRRFYQQIVDEFDADRDDRISVEEYASAIRGYDPTIRSVMGSTWEQFKSTFAVPVAWRKHRKMHKLHCKEERNRAKSFDLNRDGRVDRDEFDTTRNLNFLRVDLKKDGIISYEEARKVHRRLYRIAERAEKKG